MQGQDDSVITGKAIGAAIEVHRELDGLLESAYEHALTHEFTLRGINFGRQKILPVIYKGNSLDCGYRLDFFVEDEVIVELKSVAKVLPVHHAQVMTYLKLNKTKRALLLNFNVAVLARGGIKRVSL